jgi:hypothetical protein
MGLSDWEQKVADCVHYADCYCRNDVGFYLGGGKMLYERGEIESLMRDTRASIAEIGILKDCLSRLKKRFMENQIEERQREKRLDEEDRLIAQLMLAYDNGKPIDAFSSADQTLIRKRLESREEEERKRNQCCD